MGCLLRTVRTMKQCFREEYIVSSTHKTVACLSSLAHGYMMNNHGVVSETSGVGDAHACVER